MPYLALKQTRRHYMKQSGCRCAHGALERPQPRRDAISGAAGKSPGVKKGQAAPGREPADHRFGGAVGPSLVRIPGTIPSGKIRKLALISALSLKMKEQRIIVLRDFPMEEIKTQKFKAVFDRFGLKKALFVLDQSNAILEKSCRNIQGVKLIRAEGINVYDLLNHEHVVFLEPSVKKIEGTLTS
jgi:large subunit ribosomal protein L4